MSDPNRDGPYECCGRKMKPITHETLKEVCAFLCRCGVYRHAYPVRETQKRALTDAYMQRLIGERNQ